MDYLVSSSLYLRGRDMDGKLILFYKFRLHTRGSKNMDDLKRCFLYWIERGFREAKNDQMTMVFDLMNSGMSNIEMEYMNYIINTLKTHYPNSLNYTLIYEMPWFMNGKEKSFVKASKALIFPLIFHFPATFQILKRLLPKPAVKTLRFINAKTARQYIDDENIPLAWGGKDDYVYSFVPEIRQNEELTLENGTLHHYVNNNNAEQKNFNLVHRKVSWDDELNVRKGPLECDWISLQWWGFLLRFHLRIQKIQRDFQ